MSRMIRHDAGFCKPEDAYFEYILSVPQHFKQPSPFIILLPGDTHAVVNVDRVLSYPVLTEVLNAWPGRFRTDVFQFKVIDLMRYIQGGK